MAKKPDHKRMTLKEWAAAGGGVPLSSKGQKDQVNMAGGGIAKLIKKAVKGTQETLPAAEREANLAKFLEPSKTPMRLYHGTMASEGRKGQEAIKRIKPSKEGALGSGVYLTPNSEFASTYAGFPARSQLERDIQTGSDFAKQSANQLLDRMNRGAIEPHEIGGNMVPVYAQLRNPLMLEGKGDPMIEALTKLGIDQDAAIRMVEKAYEGKGYIGKEVESRARAAGYDGLMQYRNGELTEVVSYNPNAVKSAIGNRGTYDITSPELSKAEGGSVKSELNKLLETGMKKGGEAEEKPYIGYRSAGRRPESQQDRKASADIPMAALRGFVSGTLGLPSDLLNLPGAIYSGVTGKESYELPFGSEDIERRLPFRGASQTPAGRLFTGAGQLAGGAYTGPLSGARAALAVPKAIGKASKDFVLASGQPATNVIKSPGGNWMTGSVERALKPLKGPYDTKQAREELRELREQVGDLPRYREADRIYNNQDALDQWIDRNLTNYVKKQMATPDDPVRGLAERGILHIEPQGGAVRAHAHRDIAGMPVDPTATSPLARAWEDVSDAAVVNSPYKDYLQFGESMDEGLRRVGGEFAVKNPDVRAYAIDDVGTTASNLGFDHIVDVLKQDLASGRIRPEQLSKVSMEQAVRRTYEYDQEMAKKMREAHIKATEGMPVYREYPEGYRWVELSQPKELPAGWSKDSPGIYLGPNGERTIINPNRQALEDALKYEGDTMGHCVGGYCPDVLEGRTKIYSLRDAKGEPHVTVEVRPVEDKVRDSIESAYSTTGEKGFKTPDGQFFYGMDDAVRYEMQFVANDPKMAPEIVQIKGKQNRAPKEEYLPFVQDFVRGGTWSGVGDFGNTGLMRTDDIRKAGWNVGDINQPYLTKQEYDDLLLKQLNPEGMKAGGEVNLASGGFSKAAAEAMSKLKGARKEFAERTAEYARYQKETAQIPTKDLLSFDEWKAKQINVTPENIEQLRKETGNKAGGEVKMQAGGVAKTLKNLLSGGAKVEDSATGAQRAAAGRKAADVAKATEPMKMSEALGNLNVEGKGKVKVTQSDRTRVGGGNIGGAMFPGLSQVDPFYQDLVWGVGKKSTGSGLINQSDDLTYWSTLLGSEDQLKSNPIVFNKLKSGFLDAMKEGKLSKELEGKINKNLALTFGEGADIRDPKIWQKANTFEKRTALADVMLGQGIAPGKGGVALGGEKSGKGVIFKPTDILKKETEPLLLHPEHGGNVPTFAVGPRLFQLSGDMQVRPDLHPGFPVLLEGQDMGMVFRPAPGEIAMRDFNQRMLTERGRKPGYYEWTMGEKGKGLPSQLITDEYLTYLQKQGYAEGGEVTSGLSALEKV